MDSTGIRRFSQFGEDGVISWCFNGKRNGFYVDIGCHDPYRFSNTAVLHLDYGWRGVNVDMDNRAIDRFRSARAGDINLCVGVAGTRGRMEATFFEEGAVNSLDPVSAASPAWAHSIREKIMVDVEPLCDILRSHASGQKIDFLNVDAEGLDYEIITSSDWSVFRPSCVAIESHGFNIADAKSDPSFNYLSQQGYRLLSHVVATSIYVLWSDIESYHRLP